MANVATKADASVNTDVGDALATVDKGGNAKTVDRGEIADNDNNIERLNAWYNGRIAVNPTYYSS
jgi:hypothetical protein